MAKPTKYRRTWPKRARKMAEEGMSEKDIAASFGIHPTNFSKMKKRIPELEEALRVGKGTADRIVENALYKRACGYDYEEEVTEIKEYKNGEKVKMIKRVKKHVAPDVRAQEMWLYNREPELWKRNRDEHNSGIDPNEAAAQIREALAEMDKLDEIPNQNPKQKKKEGTQDEHTKPAKVADGQPAKAGKGK